MKLSAEKTSINIRACMGLLFAAAAIFIAGVPSHAAAGDESWDALVKGNKRFVAGSPAAKNTGRDRRDDLVKGGQHPVATIITCSDSRVPPEHLFDQGLGDVFIVRTAGNVLSPISLGSVEYGVEHLKTPLLVILGHTGCGAVKATLALKGEPEGNIGAILRIILPAVEKARKAGGTGQEIERHAIEENMKSVKASLLANSPVVKELVHEGKLSIVMAVYDLDTGEVRRLQEQAEVHAGHQADGGGMGMLAKIIIGGVLLVIAGIVVLYVIKRSKKEAAPAVREEEREKTRTAVRREETIQTSHGAASMGYTAGGGTGMMTWFSNLRVGTKVLIASAMLILLTVVVASQGLLSLRTANTDFNEFYNDRFIPVRQLNRIMRNLLQIRINMIQEYESAQENNWGEVEKRALMSKELAAEYNDLWDKFSKSQMTAEEKKLADEWTVLAKVPAATRADYKVKLEAKDLATAKVLLDKWREEYQKLRDKTDELIVLQQREGESLKAEVDSAASSATMIALAVLGFSIVMGAIITIILSRSVTGPVRKGLTFAQQIADGDLTSRIDLDQKDELGQLAKALNQAADNLEDLVSNVIVASQNLAQAVEQISSGNQNLSQRTSEQASSLEEVASTIEEATATINQNAENAQAANKNSEGTYALAEEGGKVVGDAVSAIIEINDSSKKIGEIISVINEISFQTNLLALNAAVEAARAGEQGRGFAVVAGEVRNLAQRSSSAAKEIESLIKDSLGKVDKGTNLANKSGEALKEIIKSIKQVSQVVSEIAAASDEQKQGINQINTAITEMDTMTQQNASLVEETASASEEMANQAQELLHMMERFRIKEQVKRDVYREKHREVHLQAADLSKDGGNGKKAKAAQARPAAAEGSHLKQTFKEEGFEEF